MVYVALYNCKMRRTNNYLSEAEEIALDAKAAAEGSTRNDVLRSLVDREMNLDGGDDDALDALLVEFAGDIAKRARTLSRRDPELRGD